MKVFIPAVLFALVTSCGSAKKIAYLEDVPDSLYNNTFTTTLFTYTDPVIKPNDILQISILTLDPQANSILTAANSASFAVQSGSISASAPPSINGFMVDKDGNIELPLAGKIKVQGSTTTEAKEMIRNRIAALYRDPVVSVRYINFTITVLGEVARPSSYTVPNEKISVLDAIGMAGDLTIYGKRDNILLVRDSADKKIYARLDLNASSITQSPYFYLRQGDVLYVEPNKAKIASTDAAKTRNIGLAATGLSLLIVIVSRLF